MDSPTQPPAAPAQPAAPVTQPATQAAVATGNTSAFRAARRAERVGKPLAAVPVTPTPTPTEAPAAPAQPTAATPTQSATPTPEPRPSRREREQEETNNRIRTAVDRATLDLRSELDRLRAQLGTAPGTTPGQPAAEPPAPNTPEWKRYRAMADAPKLEQFESVEDHSAAMALFVADKRHEERQAQAAAHTTQEQLTAAERDRVGRFTTQLETAKAADPEFVGKLTPDVRALKPFAALLPGEAGGPANVIAEQIFDSPVAPQVLLHLSQHPEDLQRLTTVPAAYASLPPEARAKAHIQWIVREFGKLEGKLEPSSEPTPAPTPSAKTISDAPNTETLGTRPSEPVDTKVTAIRRGDTRAYRELRRQERAAGRR